MAGGSGMSMMLRELFQLVWDSECIPEHWEEGIIAYFKKVIKKILIIIEVSHY